MLDTHAASTMTLAFAALMIAALAALAVALLRALNNRNRVIAATHATLRQEIKDRLRSDGELRVAREEAEEANRAKARFLANMSHEIRTPLGAIIGFSELLMNPSQTTHDRAECISAIRRNGDLLSNIITDILDLSKVEAGKFQMELQEVDLAEVITDISSLLGLQAREKGILLTVKSGPDVPERICTDPLRLRQVLVNVVGNAIKFTTRGEVGVRIGMQCGEGNARRLAFVVRDTGPGIQHETAKRLFNLFSQGETKTHRPGYGTGLGLALSRRLAQLLGGDVVLSQTEVGKGSVFTVTVDPGTVSNPRIEEFRPSAEQRRVEAPQVRLDGTNVLVIDDSPDNQVLITRFLTMAGAAVDVANNGREGLEKIGARPFDVVIMDIQMPVMDGYEAVAHLRGQGYGKPILALTAHALKEEQRRCLALGFDSHLSKPVNRGLLLKEVARFARRDAYDAV